MLFLIMLASCLRIIREKCFPTASATKKRPQVTWPADPNAQVQNDIDMEDDNQNLSDDDHESLSSNDSDYPLAVPDWFPRGPNLYLTYDQVHRALPFSPADRTAIDPSGIYFRENGLLRKEWYPFLFERVPTRSGRWIYRHDPAVMKSNAGVQWRRKALEFHEKHLDSKPLDRELIWSKVKEHIRRHESGLDIPGDEIEALGLLVESLGREMRVQTEVRIRRANRIWNSSYRAYLRGTRVREHPLDRRLDRRRDEDPGQEQLPRDADMEEILRGPGI